MRGLEKRLSALEKLSASWLATNEEEVRRQAIQRALQRLSVVELSVLTEVLELRCEHPDMSGAGFWRLLTSTQRNMESLWRWVLWKESQTPDTENEESDAEMKERMEELARRRAITTPDTQNEITEGEKGATQ